MNEHTEAVLDYTYIKRELQTYAVTPMGKALAVQLRPLTDPARIDTQLRETSEMVRCLSAGEEPPLAAMVDLRPYLAAAQIEGWYLESRQLLEVAQALEVVQRLRRYVPEGAHPLLSRRLAQLTDFSLFLRHIRHAIDDHGQVRDQASPALLRVRQTLKRLRERIQTQLRAFMATHSGVVQEAVVTIRNNRFVIPLKTACRPVLPGIIHGESASGATLYVEPQSIVHLNNHLQQVQSEEERAVREVLRELTARLADQRVALAQAMQILGEIDLICAKGRLSLRMQGSEPRFTPQTQLRLVAARHPLLPAPVPVDVHLGPESRTLVITGPNTGGKTAVLKTVGLLVLMAQSGLHIPADSQSVLPRFTAVFVDLGDEQNLQQNLSTFSAHLANICTMIPQVSRHTLVLLDELGAGTDPLEGGPLGVAILDALHQRGAMTLATTHHGAMKAYAVSTPYVTCAAVDFDLQTLQPRYQLVYGLPGRSQAFLIAEKLGLPCEVLVRAQQEAGTTQRRGEQLVASLEAQRQALEEEQRRVEAKHAMVDRLLQEAHRAREEVRAEEYRIRQSLYAEGQALLKTARRQLDATLAALRRQAPPGTSLAFPHQAWQHIEQAVTALAPMGSETQRAAPSLRAGERVRVRGLNVTGRLRSQVKGHGPVQVEVGSKTLTVAAAELEPLEEADRQSVSSPTAHSPHPVIFPRCTPVPPELRLLGYTVAAALPAVEKYLDQAFVDGASQVRIVHGIGSGRLRQAVTKLLSAHPLVHRFQPGDAGGGMTIVELER